MPIHWRKILPNDTLSGLQFFQLFRYGLVFLISIILPRAGLLPDQVGLFEAFLFFAGVVSYFWVTGLIQALLPLAGDRGNQMVPPNPPDTRGAFASAKLSAGAHPSLLQGGAGVGTIGSKSISIPSQFFNAFLLLLLFSALSAVTLLLASPVLERLLGQELPREIIWLVVLYLVLFAPSTLVEYWYVITDQTKRLFRYGVVAFTLQILIVGLPVIFGFGVKGAIWGMIAAGGFRMIWLGVILVKNGDFSLSFPFWKKYLDLGTPIILSVLLSGSAQYVNGFIVSAKFDPAVFAIFRYGAESYRWLPCWHMHSVMPSFLPSPAMDRLPD